MHSLRVQTTDNFEQTQSKRGEQVETVALRKRCHISHAHVTVIEGLSHHYLRDLHGHVEGCLASVSRLSEGCP
jgi:hypothetical protein